MNHNVYTIGEVARVSTVFRDQSGAYIDPTEVHLIVQDPTGFEAAKTPVTRDDTGHYHFDVDADRPGRWYYRWYSLGTGKAADEGSFVVKESKFSV